MSRPSVPVTRFSEHDLPTIILDEIKRATGIEWTNAWSRKQATDIIARHLAAARVQGKFLAQAHRPIDDDAKDGCPVLLFLAEFNTPAVALWFDEAQRWVTPGDYFDIVGTPIGWLPCPQK